MANTAVARPTNGGADVVTNLAKPLVLCGAEHRLREHLDSMNDGKPETDDDLEVGILWLTPIFPSRSHHGYDVTDYRDVHPDFGTL